MPLQFLRWQVRKEGFEPVEVGSWRALLLRKRSELHFSLFEETKTPPGMVWVEGGTFSLLDAGIGCMPEVALEPYWIDKFEVTNRDFKKFVDAGGYTTERYWKQKFLKDGKELSWLRAVALFRDKTGRSGPSTWELSNYPEGQADYPASGVSWYEAAAYAEFAGKSLPRSITGMKPPEPAPPAILFLSATSAERVLAAVGNYLGLGPHGTYDMAGNAKEWCWNLSGKENKRYVLGGAWNEPAYMFEDPDAQSPFTRSPEYGFRLVRYTAPPPASAMGPLQGEFRDFSRERPVSDEVFRAYRSLCAYDKGPLNSAVESVDDSSENGAKRRSALTQPTEMSASPPTSFFLGTEPLPITRSFSSPAPMRFRLVPARTCF
jgi:eukaryotic-like serine/threonine-protein kinase